MTSWIDFRTDFSFEFSWFQISRYRSKIYAFLVILVIPRLPLLGEERMQALVHFSIVLFIHSVA